MIKISNENNKGITLISLMLAIIIMIIISSILIYNAGAGIETRKLNNMYNDIKILKDRIDIYYSKYETLPIINTKYTNVNKFKTINENDGDDYYVINLESLDNLTLTYGNGYNEYKTSPNTLITDIYVINEQSHAIYYVAGIELDGKIYYTTIGESTKVETPSVCQIKLQNIQENKATIELSATSKNIGIKMINLYKGDEIYHTFDYTRNYKETKKETIDVVLPFYEESIWHIQAIHMDNTSITSNEITLKNEEVISTKEDLNSLAEIVNNGNSLLGKTVYLLNDIDLKGNNANKWTPIGNSEHPFNGTFEGNNKTISGLYIDEKTDNQGLFGYNEGTIKKFKISGNITSEANYAGMVAGKNGENGKISNVITSGEIIGFNYTGGITGYNYGQIEKCGNLAQISATGNVTGGITSINENGKISKCYNKAEITGNNRTRRNCRRNTS